MMSNDPSFPSEIPFEGYTFADDRVVFSDILFNGKKKTIILDVLLEEIKPGYYLDCDTIIIEFSSFLENTYSYYNSLSNHIDEGKLDIFGGEVVPVYSNVQNGLGILLSVKAQRIQLRP